MMTAKKTRGHLRIGGHSKGGNLAIYATSQCRKKIQSRITAVYSNDAPGFHESFIAGEDFTAIKDLIHSYVPQGSIIGMFLEHGEPHTVIKSTESGIMQHDLYSWEVTHNDMAHAEDLTLGSRFMSNTLREWIAALDNTRREQFSDALFHIVGASKATSFFDIEDTWLKSVGRMIQALGATDEATKHLIKKTLKELIRSARNNMDTLFNNDE
jgi:hypothetical protein